MPVKLDNLQILHDYIDGVLKRANHHAPQIITAALAITGGVIWRHDPRIDLECRTYAGQMANVLWFETTKSRYALVYNHGTGQIDLRARNQNGVTVASFDNTNVASISLIFATL